MTTSSYTAAMRGDLRDALRLMRRRPGVSALAVSTLAIGIAATTIVFSLADALIWHPLPFRDADRLVRIRATVGVSESLSRLSQGQSLFDGPYPFGLDSAIVNVGGEARAVTIAVLSDGVLQTLGVKPTWGRGFAANEFVAGNAVVIVSGDLWRRQQSAASSSNDRSITLDGIRHVIVGVMPDGFEFPVSRVALWRPYVPDSTSTRMTALGRLKPGVTIGQAQAFAATTAHVTRVTATPDIRIVPFLTVDPSTATALRLSK
jgi:putative ABC transport system permease protein